MTSDPGAGPGRPENGPSAVQEAPERGDIEAAARFLKYDAPEVAHFLLGLLDGRIAISAHGRRIGLRVDPDNDGCGQFQVSLTVDGALSGKDVEIWAAYLTDRSEPDAA